VAVNECGNRAQFGDHGVQDHDNPATISVEAQHTLIVSSTMAFLDLLNEVTAGGTLNYTGIGDPS